MQKLSQTTPRGITPPPAASGTTSYQWDAQDRLSSVTLPNGETHSYDYDYRTRRIGTHKLISGVQQAMTAIVFAGGLSLAEYDSTTSALPATPTVEYTRGPDMGGGVGGMLYSLRSGTPKYSLSNGRGDIVAQADASATLTWTASYEAYGRRTKETGANQDKQRGNSKDEDPTGLLNEGFRYRDLETGVWLSRDPAGFVDGPNVYAYVKQNPWTGFDAHGLETTIIFGVVIGGRTPLFRLADEQDYQDIESWGGFEFGFHAVKPNIQAVKEKPGSYVKGVLTGQSDGTRAGNVGRQTADLFDAASMVRGVSKPSGGGAHPLMVTPNGGMVPAPAVTVPAAGAPAITPTVLFNQNSQSGGSPEASAQGQAQKEAAKGVAGKDLPGKGSGWTKMRGNQGWKDGDGNIWKKDQLHKDHWDISDRKGNKVREVDFKGGQIWPKGPKNKNK